MSTTLAGVDREAIRKKKKQHTEHCLFNIQRIIVARVDQLTTNWLHQFCGLSHTHTHRKTKLTEKSDIEHWIHTWRKCVLCVRLCIEIAQNTTTTSARYTQLFLSFIYSLFFFVIAIRIAWETVFFHVLFVALSHTHFRRLKWKHK